MVALAFLGISNPEIAAAWIAAGVSLLVVIVSAPVRVWVEKRLVRQKVTIEYEQSQREALRTQVGAHHGHLHDAGFHLRRRLVNLEKNWSKGWMRVAGDYSGMSSRDRYYFPTTVHRFMLFMALANKFSRAAIHVDNRVAEPADRYFIGYLNAMEWALTDVELFRSEDYDITRDTAHFFTDHFRRMCSTLLDKEGDPLDLEAFDLLLAADHELEPVLAFFDGIEPGIARDAVRRDLRWDRLIVFRLFLMGFVTTIGYEYEQDNRYWFERVATLIEHPGVAAAAADWVPRFGLARGDWYWRPRNKDKAGKEIIRALRARADRDTDAPDGRVAAADGSVL
jgi:hypothetical protein